MNVESILSKIALFKELVIDSGFKRDLQDYIAACQQAQNKNLVYMKDISSKVSRSLEEFVNYSLDTELGLILKDTNPFTGLDSLKELNELDKDTEIDAAAYHTKIHGIMNRILQAINQNEGELNTDAEFLSKYTSKETVKVDSEKAFMSLVFKDLKSTGSLKQFSKVLHRWNRTLLLYHTLLKSESPEEISLVEIQNGSIDVIFNIDFDIAIDLTEVIKTGLKVYGVYLLYKAELGKKIIAGYFGNKKLLKNEEERDKLLLENVKEAVKSELTAQHKERLAEDKKIDKAGADKKIDEISDEIVSHIVKGNEVKFLNPPTIEEDEVDDEGDEDLPEDLRKSSAVVRDRFKKLRPEDQQLLLDRYTKKDDEEDEE